MPRMRGGAWRGPSSIRPKAERPHTYTRSAKSKNRGKAFTPYDEIHPDLQWDNDKKDFKRKRPITANVSGFQNFLGTFDVPIELERISRDRWQGDSELYNAILRYQVRSCRFLAGRIKHASVYTANEYPCLQIDVSRIIRPVFSTSPSLSTADTLSSYCARFVEYACPILNGYIDFIAFRAGFLMPCVVRSSFGFFTPTTADTAESIRVAFGLAPVGYLLCVEEAIEWFLEDLAEFVKGELPRTVDIPFFRSDRYAKYRKMKTSPFTESSTVLDFLTTKVDAAKGLLEDAQRTFAGTSLATEHAYRGLTEEGNGIVCAVRALFDDSLWSLTGPKGATLSFDFSDNVKPYQYDVTHPMPCRKASSEDPDFVEITNLIFERTKTPYRPEGNDDQFTRWRVAVFAAERVLLDALSYRRTVDGLNDDSGSDSEEEFDSSPDLAEIDEDAPCFRMFHSKLVTQNGMNAIAIALQCARMWFEDVLGRPLHEIDKLPLDKAHVRIGKTSYTPTSFDAKSTSLFAPSGGELEYQPGGKGKWLKMEVSDPVLLTKSARIQHGKILAQRKDIVAAYLEKMYFETPHLLEINRWMRKVERLEDAEIMLVDANHLQTSVPTGASTSHVFDTVQLASLDLGGKLVVIYDVTSTTTDRMRELIMSFAARSDSDQCLLMLADSGLKHHQMGTDRNAYGTVRFICFASRKDPVDAIVAKAKKLSAYRKQSVLSHSVRRAFKDIGATPTIRSILGARESAPRSKLERMPSSLWPGSTRRGVPLDVPDLDAIIQLVGKITTDFPVPTGLTPPTIVRGSFSQFGIPGGASACSPISVLALGRMFASGGPLACKDVNQLVVQGSALYQGMLGGLTGAQLLMTVLGGAKTDASKPIYNGVHLNPFDIPDAAIDAAGLVWGAQHTCSANEIASALQQICKAAPTVGVAMVMSGYTVAAVSIGGRFYLFDSHGFGAIKEAFVESHATFSSLVSTLHDMVRTRCFRGTTVSLSVFTPKT